MGRLTSAPSRLAGLPPRLASTPVDTASRDRERASFHAYRAWYKTAEWQRLRQQVFARDGLVCQATGELLVGRHPAPNSPVADHRRPHRGDRALFFDPANVWTVSKAYHDGEKQRLEQAADQR